MDCIKDGVFYERFIDNLPFECITGLPVEKVVYHGRSPFQDVLVFDSSTFGRVLVLDGAIQLSTFDEFGYHETLSFAALSCHRNPQNVLIIGGGDGGMAREVLKFPSVQSITVCEIDEVVVKVCSDVLPELSRSFEHPKVNLVIEDASKYLENKEDLFDVIICDSTDPDWGEGNSNCLFGETFYDMVKKALKKNGTYLFQSGDSIWRPMVKKVKTYRTRFPVVSHGFVSVAIFSLSQNGFILCSLDKGLDVRQPYWKFTNEELERMNLKFYNYEVHRGSFAIPNYLQKYLKDGCNKQQDVVKWMKTRFSTS